MNPIARLNEEGEPMTDPTNETEKSIYIDPPSGWQYGFPKKAPANLREMDTNDLNIWLSQNGYPMQEIEIWTNDPRFDGVPCRFFEA